MLCIFTVLMSWRRPKANAEYSLIQIGSNVQVVYLPTSSPLAYSLSGQEQEKRENLDAVQALLNHIQNTGVLPTLLGQQILNIGPYRLQWRKLTPRQPDPAQWSAHDYTVVRLSESEWDVRQIIMFVSCKLVDTYVFCPSEDLWITSVIHEKEMYLKNLLTAKRTHAFKKVPNSSPQ